MTLSFTVYGKAAPAGSKRAFNQGGHIRVVDANPNAKGWKNDVAQAAIHAMLEPGDDSSRILEIGPLLTGPLSLSIVFVIPRPKSHYGKRGLRPTAPARPTVKPDLLKLARGVEDALTGVIYRDDAQIVGELLIKEYGEPARVEITIRQVNTTSTARREISL